MNPAHRKADRIFLGIASVLALTGIFVFLSASMGLLVRDEELFRSVVKNQLLLGFMGGTLALLVVSRIPYLRFRRLALPSFLGALFLTILVFTPIGFEHGGAKRWVSLFGFSFQPSEILKPTFVLYFAALLASFGERVKTVSYGLAPAAILLAIIGVLLLAQPDLGTYAIIYGAALGMLAAAGVRMVYISILALTAVSGVAALALIRPYVLGRLLTFLDPGRDPFGASYQVNQSLVAIGSGGITGKGFGQSVQKFGQLPEPIGDSIFAVASEEFGLLGGLFIIFLFVAFAVAGLRIARRAPDRFSGLLVTGLVILITGQAFLNIASMIAVAPIVGVPLPFVSHGGTALFVVLLATGIILQVSKYQRH